jgi:hypothetical protein
MSQAAPRVRVGCVVDAAPRFGVQALTLLRSLRWFGGRLADAPVLICAVGELPAETSRAFADLGADVRQVAPFVAGNPSANRLHWFDVASSLTETPDDEFWLLLDCDTFIARDPFELLRPEVVQAKIEGVPSVTLAAFARLFATFGLPLPPADRINARTGTATIPYYNAGVLAGPSAALRRLAAPWAEFNRALAAHPERVAPCEKHLHQAALSLALAATGLPIADAPDEFNYQLNVTHLTPSLDFLARDPAIVHYHDHVDAHGRVLASPFPLAQWRIDRLNGRLDAVESTAESGARPRERIHSRTDWTFVVRPTSTATATPPDLDPRSPRSPRSPMDLLDRAVLAALGATPEEPLGADPERLPPAVRERFVEAGRDLLAGLSCDDSSQDQVEAPLACWTLPLWREAAASLEPPRTLACAIDGSHPLRAAVAAAEADGRSIAWHLARWELALLAALEGSSGLRRSVLSAPGPATTGDEGDLLNPAQQRLWQTLVHGDLVTLEPPPGLSRQAADLLQAQDAAHRAWREARRGVDHRDALIAIHSGEVTYLSGETARLSGEVAGLSREVADLEVRLATTRAHGDAEARRADEFDQLLRVVFGSRTWRVGRFAGAWYRRVRSWWASPTHEIPRSAFDRWRERHQVD